MCAYITGLVTYTFLVYFYVYVHMWSCLVDVVALSHVSGLIPVPSSSLTFDDLPHSCFIKGLSCAFKLQPVSLSFLRNRDRKNGTKRYTVTLWHVSRSFLVGNDWLFNFSSMHRLHIPSLQLILVRQLNVSWLTTNLHIWNTPMYIFMCAYIFPIV